MKRFFAYPLFYILLSVLFILGCDDEKERLNNSFSVNVDEGYFSDDIVIKMEQGETLNDVEGFLTLTGEDGKTKTLRFEEIEWSANKTIKISTKDSVNHIKKIDLNISSKQGNIQYKNISFTKK